MIWTIPEPPTHNRPSRQEIIEADFPQATSAIKRIMESSADIRYGSPSSAFLNDYHFQSADEVESYFRHYLKERHGDQADDDLVRSHVLQTLNHRPPGIQGGRSGCNACFDAVANGMIEEINYFDEPRDDVARAHQSMLRFIVGATGAGKTAFSKALFCVSLLKFWAGRIVPTRIEYSKISHRINGGRGRILFDYVRKCQLRDLLIYLVYNPEMSPDEKLRVIADLRSQDTETTRKLTRLIESEGGDPIDGENRTVSLKVQQSIEAIYLPLDASEQSVLLYALNEYLDVSFLISFDGFDAVHIDDFLFEPGSTPPAVEDITKVIRRLWRRETDVGLHLKPTRAHYLVYLRDTTFERLKTDLIRGVGETLSLPMAWIAPPKYEQLAQNAATKITGEADPRKNNCQEFVSDTFHAFNDAIFDAFDGLTARSHLSFVFGSNARRMKLHIVRSLIWALHRAAQSGTVDFLRKRSGVDPRWLWTELIVHQGVLKIPNYLTLEELYLNDSRQLVPTLNVNYVSLGQALAAHSFKDALNEISDHDEVAASYGCVLNYFLPRKLKQVGEETDLPQMLVLVRMMQYIGHNHRCNLGAVVSFIRCLGYDLNDAEARFCFYLLVRNRLVMWDGSTGGKAIDTTPLYLTTKGKILIERLIYTVSYASESILNALHFDRKMVQLLNHRVFDSVGYWIVDCIHNASTYCYLLDRMESAEMKNAREHKMVIDKYQIGASVRARLNDESRTILKGSKEAALNRHILNLDKLNKARSDYPDLVPIGAAR